MQILVLGNGYDRSAGLPTGYEQYFQFVSDQYPDYFQEFKFLLAKPVEENTIGPEEIWINSSTNHFELRFDEVKYDNKYKQPIKDYISIVSDSNILKKISNSDITLWHLYFYYCNIFGNINDNWSSVEEKILEVIQFEDPKSPLYIQKNDIDVNNSGLMRLLESKMRTKYHPTDDTIHIGNEKIDRDENNTTMLDNYDKAKIIFSLFLCEKYSQESENSIVESLKKELLDFEEDFRKYIEGIYTDLVTTKGKRDAYRSNLRPLLSKGEKELYILNFNYTDLSLTKESISFDFQVNKETIKANQNNVHGIYYDKIVFGIDHNEIKTKDDKYIFTKTFRKLETKFKNKPKGLPSKESVNVISFFGHSLAKADYSYFKSIFDFYDIYDSNTLLIFYFYNYDDSPNKRIETTREVVGLLESFANNMYNGHVGKQKNLLHKLILEDRLKISEVKMKKILK
ncbi:AbiH family protein [Erysipelothrix rhusiopathiae]|nr:AbiH family protein [Erysipelothrix rhusiopathiae]MDE8059199.1 AbiH family protein [Erysipelothrix rhusiopathiae]MDE8067719.1 AbiH family protein [Erysipelothrix rhusiopathiae]MDE8077802.1 AbiH family protein [Erysipelothrix rhusiopathiae]MDE8082899.1 AbiH family protein [Erysipelothrix rhusiopathiae]